MSKRQRTADERHRDTIECAVRQIRGAMQTYWSLCNSWCAGAPLDDPELRHRMMNTRAHAIAVVCALMPVPTAESFDEDRALPEQCRVH